MEKSYSPFSMLQQLFVDASPLIKIFLLIILMGTSAIFFTFLGMLIALPVFSLSFVELQTSLEEGFISADLNIILFFQAVQTLGLFIIPALLANNWLVGREESFLRIMPGTRYAWGGLIISLTLVAALPLIQSLIWLNEAINFPQALQTVEEKLITMEQERNLLSNRMISEVSIRGLLTNILVIAILPALGEEFLFRGVLQGYFQRWMGNKHLAILLAAALFSAFHMQFYGFIPRMLLGVYFGYILLWSRNIWLAVFAHFMNNAMAVLVIFLSNKQLLSLPAWFGDAESQSFAMTLISIALSTITLLILKRLLKTGARRV